MSRLAPPLRRRRFLAITAAAGMTAAGPAIAASVQRWSGRALGAEARMVFSGLDAEQAERLFGNVEQEIQRLERIFSLYDATSEVRRLNGVGTLEAPSPELVEVLSLCGGLVRATRGAFDPTVQPLWQHYAEAKSNAQSPDALAIADARKLIGWDNVSVDLQRISFANPGMGLTLNGIAQGYVTDRIAALLRRNGLRDVLVDIGELMALGQAPDTRPWDVGIAASQDQIVARLQLSDRAVATSRPDALMLNDIDGLGHILDPRSNEHRPMAQLVSVSAGSAAVADGLSTAGCLMSKHDLEAALEGFRGTKLEVYDVT